MLVLVTQQLGCSDVHLVEAKQITSELMNHSRQESNNPNILPATQMKLDFLWLQTQTTSKQTATARAEYTRLLITVSCNRYLTSFSAQFSSFPQGSSVWLNGFASTNAIICLIFWRDKEKWALNEWSGVGSAGERVSVGLSEFRTCVLFLFVNRNQIH